MPVTIVESDAFPTTLTAPAAGESASAPGLVSQFLQGIANRSRWLYNRLIKFDVGGSFTPSDNLSISVAAGKYLFLNGFTINAAADGGDATTYGTIVSTHSVFAAAVTGGTVSVPYSAEYVFGGASASADTIWQITAPPAGASATRRWVMKVHNFSGFTVTLKSSTGATITTLQQASSATNGCVIGFNGSTWEVMAYVFYHS
jgi:hypothetical protein